MKRTSGKQRAGAKKAIRRKLLAPVLGIAVAAPALLPAAALAEGQAAIRSVEFIGMPAPATAQDMARVYTSATAVATYSDGTVKYFPLAYQTLMKSTDVVRGTPAGAAIDANGKPIIDYSVPDEPTPFVSDDPDANSLFQVAGAPATGKGGNPLSLVTHYEYVTSDHAGKSAYGIVPASMSLSTIDQDKKTGALTVTDLKKIDFSGVGGLWIPCNGSLTPWNTHLGSEEYDADAREYEQDPSKTYVGPFAKAYYQDPGKAGNPYAYGYIPEVTVHPDQTTTVVKHYSMGRFSHELGKVAPDGKTVFFGDDGGNTMLFLYVADQPQDLSAGTLYAAKWVQTGEENGGSADLQWIRLGHATDSEIKSYIDRGLKFSDLFETADKDTEGFTKIKTYPSGKTEWLKVKPGMEQAAAFLESRRYGAMLGATAEFNKMEGVAVNAKDKKVYVAMSYVEKSMEKDVTGADPTDDIRLPQLKAGVTYELALAGKQSDSGQNPILSDYVPVSMKGLVWGRDLPQADALGNTADPDMVANPDNLSFSEQTRTLFIGEDSGMHVNNFVWAYNVDTHKLSRILSVPAGAEATGLQAVDNLNGFNYLMSNLQHPGDEMIVAEPLKPEVERYISENFDRKRAGLVGYVSGLPPVTKVTDPAADSSLVPVRDICEAQGAKVEWDNKQRAAIVKKGGRTLVLPIGSSSATIDGKELQLPRAVQLIDEKTVAPPQIIADFLTGKQI